MKFLLADMRRERRKILLFTIILLLIVSITGGLTFWSLTRNHIENDVISTLGGITAQNWTPAWSVAAQGISGIVTGSFVAGIVFTAYGRTYLGAGRTRKQFINLLAWYGLAMLVYMMVLTALTWGFGFIQGDPQLEGVSLLAFVNIALNHLAAYAIGAGICALYLRFRALPVTVGLIASILTIIAAGLHGLRAQTEVGPFVVETYNTADEVGININALPASDLLTVWNFLTPAIALLIGVILTVLALRSLPMRRS
ncbi:MAG: hypothetical protein GX483_03920 [Actinomycetaceae bacterium]|nr:hypothetical protein [Actinomycetaceae bacterium]